MTTDPGVQQKSFPTGVRSENRGQCLPGHPSFSYLGTCFSSCFRLPITTTVCSPTHCLDLAFVLQQPQPGLTRDQKCQKLGCQAAAEQAAQWAGRTPVSPQSP